MIKCRRFTLVELLVALGVFSVLMVVFMQLFSGMRLVWTNTQRRTDACANVRIAMDTISTLLGSTYLFNVPESTGSTDLPKLFPFKLTRSGGDAVGLYFASTAKLDLPGSAPTRFIGILFPNPAHKLGLTESGTAAEKEKAKKDLNKLYLVVISNTSENEDVNRKIYHWFWPSPDLMKAENTVADNTAEAMDTLESKLKAKVLTDKERIKLADNVTEFSVRLFKENGDELDAGATSTYSAPDSLEIRISVLGDGDYDAWVGLKGGPEKTETSGSAAETFRTAKQLTFTRRIHIGDRWKQEDSYDNY